jgi:hypothetical protein
MSDPLVEVLEMALTRPDALRPASVDLLRVALDNRPCDEARVELGLGTFAALLYSRPDLNPETLLDPVATLLYAETLPERVVRRWCRLWEGLAASPAAPRAWTLLTQALGDARLDDVTRGLLVPVVGAFAQWREDLVDLDAVLALAGHPLLAAHRNGLLDHALERCVFHAPENFTLARLERVAELFQDLPRYKYVLYALAGRPGLPAAACARARRHLEGYFPFQPAAAAILTPGPVRLLAIHNLAMGQGDDLVRLVPLLQALLDVNPELMVTLVTQRIYLYDHPRVAVIQIKDESSVQAALKDSYAGVLDFFQPQWSGFNHRIELRVDVDAMLTARPPALLVQGDMGRAAADRAGKRSQFLHQKVELGGRDIAGLRGLDRLELASSYDPGHRLLAELGLPLRAAEESSRSSSILTGTRSADADRVWADILPPGDGPVALVSPFGGSRPAKGFLGQEGLLAAELEGLASEGYRLVILPQDQEWARPAAIEAALARLGPAIRTRIRLAPDPADADVVRRLALTERPGLSPKDQVVRLFKYFTSYADLVVTVEGWLAHLAYLLGRPFRLFVAAGSFDAAWFPHGRGRTQRLVPSMSPRALPAHSRDGLLGPNDPPPVPHFPRRTWLDVAMTSLGRSGDPGASTTLRPALASADGTARAWAVGALGQLDPIGSKADLLRALGDRWPAVVREAAAALLRGDVDCSRELGSGYPQLLQAYVDGVSENWDAVREVGPPVLPVLIRLAKTEVLDVQWGATETLRRMLSAWVPGLASPETSLDAPRPRRSVTV